MLHTAEELHSFKNYGENILQKLQEYILAIQERSDREDEVPDEISRCIDIIENTAKQVVQSASSPVKIGVMGEFSSGKTTLLGCLLGYAGALPDTEVASTGNVTYLRLVQEEGFQKTQFQFTVEYLDQVGVEDCLEFMLKKAKEKALATQLPEDQLASLTSLNPKDAEVWQGIIHWCKQAESRTNNPGLRNLIKELEVFAQSYILYGAAVCGRSYTIDEEAACSGLQLSAEPMKASQENSFEQIPPEKERLPKFLKATFSLINRIDVEVKISKGIWNLSSIQGANKLVLLDFPGLGSDDSGVRDQFLCQREMENVQTILILTYGPRPGDAKSLDIFDMLQQQRQNQALDNFSLVGVGRFDELPLAEEVLDELITHKEELTDQTVLSKLPTLQKAIKSARSYTKRDERIVLLSAFVALDVLKELSSVVKVASPQILNKLNAPTFQQKSQRLRQKWKQLSQRLEETNKGSTVAYWLGKFAEDGGIHQLRFLLEKHIAAHGLNQLYEDTRNKVRVLYDQQKLLQQMLSNPSWQEVLVAENSTLCTLRQVLQELADTYKALKTSLERSPIELGMGMNEKSNKVSLRKEVEDEITSNIFRWDQWSLLLNNIQDGTVNIVEAAETTEAEDLVDKLMKVLEPIEENSNATISKVPTKTDDFYPVFENTVQQLEKFVYKRIHQVIKDLLNELSNNKISLQNGQTTVDLAPLRNKLMNSLQGVATQEEIITALRFAANPIEWEEAILSSLEEEYLLNINPHTLFPLAREDKNIGKIGQIFDWAPETRHKNQNPENHQILMLQLRDAMIASVSQQFVHSVSKANQQVNTTLRKKVLERIIPYIEKLLRNKARLRSIALGGAQSNLSTPDWLEILMDLTSIQCPL